MKIKKKTKTQRSVTLRIDETVMEKVDAIADKNGISRQKLIEAVLALVFLKQYLQCQVTCGI